MSKQLETKRTELLETHLAGGVVEVRRLARGTCLLIETPDENYELVVGTPSKGVVLIASDGRFKHRDKGVLIGSMDPDTCVFLPEIIGLGLKMVFGGERIDYVKTGPVLRCVVKGKNFEYGMWDDRC